LALLVPLPIKSITYRWATFFCRVN